MVQGYVQQITIDEWLTEYITPIGIERPSGSTYYTCNLCGRFIGLYDPREKRFTYKADECTRCGKEIEWNLRTMKQCDF